MNQHSFKLNQGGHFLPAHAPCVMSFLNQWDANGIPPRPLHIWCVRLGMRALPLAGDFHACLGPKSVTCGHPGSPRLIRHAGWLLEGNIIRAHTHPAECLRVGMEFTTIHAPAKSKKNLPAPATTTHTMTLFMQFGARENPPRLTHFIIARSLSLWRLIVRNFQSAQKALAL
jgi:hypothetical protein